MSSTLDIQILWCLSTIIQIWIAYRIFKGQLGTSFWYFGLYLAVSSAFSVYFFLLSVLKFKSNFIGYNFIAYTYMSSILEFFVVREISSNALERFPAIKAASRTTLIHLSGFLILVGAGWFYYLNSLTTRKTLSLLLPAIRFQESVALGFTLYIFLLLAFLAWMPVPLSKNHLEHSFLMGAFYSTLTISRLMVDLGFYAAQKVIADYIAFGGSILILLLWSYRVRSVDGNVLSTPKGPINTQEAAVMIRRLEELNQTLSRSGPKMMQ